MPEHQPEQRKGFGLTWSPAERFPRTVPRYSSQEYIVHVHLPCLYPCLGRFARKEHLVHRVLALAPYLVAAAGQELLPDKGSHGPQQERQRHAREQVVVLSAGLIAQLRL